MPIIAIDHIQIAMPEGEEENARAFYAGLLGFVEPPKPAQLAGRGGAWFEANGVQIKRDVPLDGYERRMSPIHLSIESS